LNLNGGAEPAKSRIVFEDDPYLPTKGDGMSVLSRVVLGLVAGSFAGLQAQVSYPPPGRLVNIGGRSIHLNCTGSGKPVVVLEAGGGAYAIDWALVQPRIAEKTRVCSYDRAGLGWSDPGPADETVEQTVDDLHAALSRAGEKGPYVLVGASVGGAFVRAYQRSFPGDVASLVFTNSSNRIGMKTANRSDLIWKLSEDEIRSVYPLPASAKGPEPTHEGQPFDRLSPELQATRLWFDQREWTRWNPARATADAMLSWRQEFLREFEEANGASPPLGRLPVVVVASDPAQARSECESRNTAASCLDYLSANTIHITAAGSGHEIHLYQPDTLVKAALQVLDAVRKKTPLV
jgi:pimeloyl-ACP methyl ester carboxylesterase